MKTLLHVPYAACIILSSASAYAQLGPLNWTEPIEVRPSSVFLLWHNPEHNTTYQKLYDFNYREAAFLSPDSVINKTERQQDSRMGAGDFTDAATGKFVVGPRDNVVSIWGPSSGRIRTMIPEFDTTMGAWSTTVQDGIVGTIQNDRLYVRTLDVDGDSLDEYVVTYLDMNDSIHIELYDVDTLLQSTLMASIVDEKALPLNTYAHVRYVVGTGDFNGDGTEEIVLVKLIDVACCDLEAKVKIYEYNGSSLVSAGENDITASTGAGLTDSYLSVETADLVADAKKEIAITLLYRTSNWTMKNYFIAASADLGSVSEPINSIVTFSLGTFGGKDLDMAAGDLKSDSLDELVVAIGNQFYLVDPSGGQVSPPFQALGTNFQFGDYLQKGLSNFLHIGDVDQNGSNEVVALYDATNGTEGFAMRVFTMDTLNNFEFVGGSLADELQPLQGTDPPDYEYRPYAIAIGNYDGLDFTIGEPTHHVATDIAQPIVILNAPPIHFDKFDQTLYDLNECYNEDEDECDFGTTYRKQTTTSIEVTTTVQADWAISAGLSSSGSTSVGVSVEAAPLGVGATAEASASVDYENHLLYEHGENFVNTSTSGSTVTIGVEVTAVEDDRIYSTITQYDVWEYPVYHGNETFPRNTIVTFDPIDVQATWLPSKSYSGVNYIPDHEVSNVLSYQAYSDLDLNPNAAQTIAADYNNDSYVLDASSNYTWFLEMSDFRSSSADTTKRNGLDVGIGYGFFRFDGDFSQTEINTHRTSVTQEIKLEVHMGSVDMGVGDAKYTVTPYAYWDTHGALVVDHAARPEVAPPGFPPTWWQQKYGTHSDPTFILPWRLDPEKGFAISEPAKRHQTKDIIFDPPNPLPGDTLTITARVRNFSLLPTPVPVTVHFFIGDPDEGGTPLIGMNGSNTVNTPGIIPARGRIDAVFVWVIPEDLQAFPRIYAVLDQDNLIDEVHEDGNKGFNVLGTPSGVIGIDEQDLADRMTGSSLCYPNPFEDITHIAFTIPQDARTTITVFDHTGRVIQVLADQYRHAGTHVVDLDGSWLATGLYYYSIRSGEFQDSGKMMLVR